MEVELTSERSSKASKGSYSQTLKPWGSIFSVPGKEGKGKLGGEETTARRLENQGKGA